MAACHFYIRWICSSIIFVWSSSLLSHDVFLCSRCWTWRWWIEADTGKSADVVRWLERDYLLGLTGLSLILVRASTCWNSSSIQMWSDKAPTLENLKNHFLSGKYRWYPMGSIECRVLLLRGQWWIHQKDKILLSICLKVIFLHGVFNSRRRSLMLLSLSGQLFGFH